MSNKKNSIILAFLILKALIGFSQIVDGPANFRDKPNGKVLFQLHNGVQISIKDSLNGWYKCVFTGYVEIPQKITDITLVPKGTKLFSKDLQLAGEVLYPIKYQYKGQIYKQKYALIEVAAYTFTKNIILKTNTSNTNKLIWDDSSISDFKYYTTDEEYGEYSISKTINYHEIYNYNSTLEYFLIKENKTQKRLKGIEKIESKIKLEIFPFYQKGDNKTLKNIEFEAHNVYFHDYCFIGEILGCCDESDQYTIYSYNTFKPILYCENKIFSYNSNGKTYFLGFKLSDFNLNKIMGKWYLADLSGIIDSLNISASDSILNDISLHVILPNKFYYNGNESNSYIFNCLEEINVFEKNDSNEIYLYMQSPDNNDGLKKSKISIINNRFSTKYKNKTFILGKN